VDRPSYVVTGGAQGIGQAISRRLAEYGSLVVLDLVDDLGWEDPAVQLVVGDCAYPEVALEAAARAEVAGPLTGWVNNAAVFRDAELDSATAEEILQLITANLRMAVNGCHVAVNHYLQHSRPGSIVNVSSHQSQRPV
jgi:NAD(P)-dependent dehydrogenase (short-subunit alcohol dehydrogenase family)